MKTDFPEFGFVASFPQVKERDARDDLSDLIREMKLQKIKVKEIASMIGPRLSWRTVESWSQNRSLPSPWTCELILEKISCNLS